MSTNGSAGGFSLQYYEAEKTRLSDELVQNDKFYDEEIESKMHIYKSKSASVVQRNVIKLLIIKYNDRLESIRKELKELEDQKDEFQSGMVYPL